MNATLGVCTLMLGGWVFGTPTDDSQPPDSQPAAQSPSSTETTPSGATQGATGAAPMMPRMPMDRSQGRADGQRRSGGFLGNSDDRSRGGGTSGTSSRQQMPPGGKMTMPAAPTDSNLAPDNQLNQWQAPTAGSGSASGGGSRSRTSGMSGGPQPGSFGSTQTPLPPTFRGNQERSAFRPTSRGSNNVGTSASPSATVPFLPPTPQEKPFSGYRAPSATSPYMNLFRNNTAGGTIDNYSTLVRPQMEQRFLNQQFGHDIHGLERYRRIQSSALKQLNRDTREAARRRHAAVLRELRQFLPVEFRPVAAGRRSFRLNVGWDKFAQSHQ